MDKISFLKLSEVLAEKGKTFYSLRKDKVVGTETIRKLQQNNGSIDTRTIKNICAYLGCQPGDIMRYLPEWVENRILELTELREEELKDYYIENSEDYSERLFYERSADFYENMLPEEIEKLSEDKFVIQGSADLEDVAEALDIEMPIDVYDTFSGFICGVLGRIPEEGEKFKCQWEDWTITAHNVKHHIVESATIERVKEQE